MRVTKFISVVILILLNNSITAQVLVKDINVGGLGSSISLVKKMDNLMFFAADDGIHGNEVWKSDGTAVGTTILKDVNPSGDGLNKTFFTRFTNIGTTLFFAGNDNINGYELWKSDGTSTGTQLVKDIKVGPSGGFSVTREMISYNGFVYFSADNGTTLDELWKSDGTVSGTVLVKNIAITGSSYIEKFTISNSILFFTANDGNSGQELWKTDGSAVGTVLVKNIATSGGSLPNYLTDVNGTLFFSAYTATNGIELWKSDGTNAGTVMVKDIKPGTGSAFSSSSFFNFNGTLYFSASDGINGEELWKSDGTPEGTVMVKDIRIGTSGGLDNPNIQSFMEYNGSLYFLANDGTTGVEIWKTDGTPLGTVLVKDIRSGKNTSSDPKELTVFNNLLYFSAYDGINPTTLWQSDGTSSGTTLAYKKGPTTIKSLIVMGNNLYFIGTDATGAELWKITEQATLPLTLTSFTAKSIVAGNQINWVTASITNVKTITLERSGVNNKFSPLAVLPATTTQFIDYNPLEGDNYYRLSSTDNNGSTKTYDKIALVNGLSNQISVYPNPVTKSVLNVVAGNQAIKSINLINLSGVKVISIQKVSNPKAVVVNTQGLTKGVYLLEIKNAQSTTVRKVIID